MTTQDIVEQGTDQREASPIDLAVARAAIEKARHLVGELAAGTQRWKMTAPVDMDRDSDMILTSALTTAKLLIAEIEQLRSEPSTEEPERTLTAVEDDRYMMATTAIHTLGDISRDEPDLARIYGEDGDDYIGQWVAGYGYVNVRFPKASTRPLNAKEIAYYRTRVLETPTGLEPVLPEEYDATVEDAHEHGFTFREGLGYLADDPFCDGCCELATEKWKASWQRPTTDAETVTADVDAKTAEAGDL